MKKELTIIIPCYNEEVTITKLILRIKKSYPELRILVIDNSSSDQTASNARKAGAEVIHEIRKGKGYAVRAGFLSSKTQFVVLIDGDLTYEVKDIGKIYNHLKQGYDMSVANRIPQTPEAYRLGHSVGNQLLSWFQQKFLGVEVQDTLSGFRGFNKEFISLYIDKPKAFEIEASLNIYSNIIGAQVYNFDSKTYC
jgi:glycosyltransferase involved in cell wall biosynthesis